MERIFWAECPHCRGRFYCNHGEMRHAGVELECPFCAAKFLPEQAAALDERTEAPADAGGRERTK
ncbi:MAG: hypothetical protein A3H35_19130 [Betaproteobacteria bacterium RIFCSPLOWO2_02_FULL_62_17]|nr:MAG: hypothetical protein A3H35_19130 [Betaproteobacteria bacterium RIFCSPLOWO2_02_FULL_62_17]